MAQEFDIQPVSLLPQASDSEVNNGEVIIVSGGKAKRASSVKMKGGKGDQGIQGIQGTQGNPGPQGTKGDKGEKGDAGPAGPQGPTGTQGLKGEKGDTGPIGSQGPKGDKGDTGRGLDIHGYYGTLAQLKVAVPNPGSGDAYGVGASEPYDIYLFDGVSNDWINNGPIQGPQGIQGVQGIQGADGADGASAYQVWLNAGNTGTEQDFFTSLKGSKGDKGDKGDVGGDMTKAVYDKDNDGIVDDSKMLGGLSASAYDKIYHAPIVTGYKLSDYANNGGNVVEGFLFDTTKTVAFANSSWAVNYFGHGEAFNPITAITEQMSMILIVSLYRTTSHAVIDVAYNLNSGDGSYNEWFTENVYNSTNGWVMDKFSGQGRLISFSLQNPNSESTLDEVADYITVSASITYQPVDNKYLYNLIKESADGKSAYQVWLGAGNTGTEQDFLTSLKGPKGDKGDTGAVGAQGPTGSAGTTAYGGLTDKPSIAGMELSGNKSWSDLGLTKSKSASLSSWITSGSYKACTITDSNITANSVVVFAPALASQDVAVKAELYAYAATANGSVTFYAKTVPTATITMSYSIIG